MGVNDQGLGESGVEGVILGGTLRREIWDLIYLLSRPKGKGREKTLSTDPQIFINLP